MNEYAMYKGEILLIIGTAKEIAEYAEIKTDTVYFYHSPAYKKRVANRRHGEGGNYITVVKL